jgi:hypothetical protein
MNRLEPNVGIATDVSEENCLVLGQCAGLNQPCSP